ncbi:MAG TPA: hypothetical protein VGE07_12425 [Herpetosiphonaceae bacterium]
MTSSNPSGDPAAGYRERRDRWTQAREVEQGRWNQLANLRLALFLAALGAATAGFWIGNGWWLLAGLVLAGGFVAAVIRHNTVERRRDRAAALAAISDYGLKRLERDWAGLPLRQAAMELPPASYAEDLDVLGHASLAHLLNANNTPGGQATLQDWLLAPAEPATIRGRQAAVAELAPAGDFRDELALHGRQLAATAGQYRLFLAWAEGAPWLERRPWLLWLGRISPLVLLALAALNFTALWPNMLWAYLLIGNGLLSVTAGSLVNARISEVASRQELFGAYAAIFGLIGKQDVAAPALRGLQARLAAGELRADQQMGRLRRIMALADLRMSMFYAFIQVATLWNIHVLWLLERWRRACGPRVGDWLAVLGEIEALAALAALKHDHPGWSFPELAGPEQERLEAAGLGHPLLRPDQCRANDLTVGPPGSFVLVTGSNMSGKSTLLRALGLNVALAQAGGPVCAERMLLPPLQLATSMRIQDSLERGVSYFMAEVQRLKLVIDQAEALAGDPGRRALYLLDEILHGTNTSERQIAARQMISHLLALGALGAVSTHDLGLADDPALRPASQPVYFTEHFTDGPDGPRMAFDYILRPGLAPSSNALKLMELIGLPVATG